MSKKTYRQGDVLILEIDAIPATAKPEKGLVLALGEATGHKHQIMNKKSVNRFVAERLQYLSVKAKAGAVVQHEEHSPITLPPGNYAVLIQTEYAPGELKLVID